MQRQTLFLAALATLLAGCGGGGGGSSKSSGSATKLTPRFTFTDSANGTASAGFASDGTPEGVNVDSSGGVAAYLGATQKTLSLAGFEGPVALGVSGDYAFFVGTQSSSGDYGSIQLSLKDGAIGFRPNESMVAATKNVAIFAGNSLASGETQAYTRVDLSTNAESTITLPADTSIQSFAGDYLLVVKNTVGAGAARAKATAARKSRAAAGEVSLYTVAGAKVVDYRAPSGHTQFFVNAINAQGEGVGTSPDDKGAVGESAVRWSASGAAAILSTPTSAGSIVPTSISDGGKVFAVGYPDSGTGLGTRLYEYQGGKFQAFATPVPTDALDFLVSPQGNGAVLDDLVTPSAEESRRTYTGFALG